MKAMIWTCSRSRPSSSLSQRRSRTAYTRSRDSEVGSRGTEVWVTVCDPALAAERSEFEPHLLVTLWLVLPGAFWRMLFVYTGSRRPTCGRWPPTSLARGTTSIHSVLRIASSPPPQQKLYVIARSAERNEFEPHLLVTLWLVLLGAFPPMLFTLRTGSRRPSAAGGH